MRHWQSSGLINVCLARSFRKRVGGVTCLQAIATLPSSADNNKGAGKGYATRSITLLKTKSGQWVNTDSKWWLAFALCDFDVAKSKWISCTWIVFEQPTKRPQRWSLPWLWAINIQTSCASLSSNHIHQGWLFWWACIMLVGSQDYHSMHIRHT